MIDKKSYIMISYKSVREKMIQVKKMCEKERKIIPRRNKTGQRVYKPTINHTAHSNHNVMPFLLVKKENYILINL